ncbi:deaminase domain-containing protein [Coleofasciculus sp. F4-SAH-05]|uniref:deaminase domain-containing protein n=1 Tax=Coleofasciculus sp. F4-SAH-05 TaxID=3069525 RepID=UPI0032FFE4C9
MAKNNPERWRIRLAQLRHELGIGQRRNIAIAEFQIGNDSGELTAVSGQAIRPGTISLPQQPLFETFEFSPGHSRAYDSEYKLLEELASRYAQTPEIQGTVNLVTERPPCVSCSYVIEQFRQRFPNIALNINDVNTV